MMMLALLFSLVSATATQEPEAPPPPPKKEFARLSGLAQKSAQEDLVALRRAEKEEQRAEVRGRLIAYGEGLIPYLFDATPKAVEEGRFPDHSVVLDAVLVEADLPLAWKLLKKKTPDELRAYLIRRWADSSRKDAIEFLKPLLADPAAETAYQAGRGLLRRGDRDGAEVVMQALRTRWTKEAALLRADFAGLERGPLADLPRVSLSSNKLAERLLGVRMFELFGVKEQIRLLHPMLSESDTSLRLAAIDACRVVMDGEAPLEKPSMTQIIEQAEAWKKRL